MKAIVVFESLDKTRCAGTLLVIKLSHFSSSAPTICRIHFQSEFISDEMQFDPFVSLDIARYIESADLLLWKNKEDQTLFLTLFRKQLHKRIKKSSAIFPGPSSAVPNQRATQLSAQLGLDPYFLQWVLTTNQADSMGPQAK